MARVIDTDVFSFFLKKDTRAELYKQHTDGHLLFLSFMTIAELERWAMLHNWGKIKSTYWKKHLSVMLSNIQPATFVKFGQK